MGWRRILAFCVTREGKLKPVEGLLVRRLSIGHQRKEFFWKRADAPFQMEEGRGGIWREEGESQTREASYLLLADRPLAWHCLPARGGGSLQMQTVVILGHGVDGVQCPKISHWYLSNCGESLQGELPATPEQPLVGL